MTPHRPKSNNKTRPEHMGRVFYLKTAFSSLPKEIQAICLSDPRTLSQEEMAKVRQYQKAVDFLYDAPEPHGKVWDTKPSKKELARAAKRLANVAMETV